MNCGQFITKKQHTFQYYKAQFNHFFVGKQGEELLLHQILSDSVLELSVPLLAASSGSIRLLLATPFCLGESPAFPGLLCMLL